MNLQALLFIAAAITAQAAAKFTVTSKATKATKSSIEHVSFTKLWTLNSAAAHDIIDSIDLNLAGRVYVSHVSGLPSGVLGYVNVSGDSQAVVDAVDVTNADADDNDDDNDKDDFGELNVHFGLKASTTLSGYLLTEITLASAGAVTEVKSRRSAQVVVEDGVLVAASSNAEVQVEASESSAVYVSAASTALNVRHLYLDASDAARLQFNVKSVTITEEAQFDSLGTASVAVLASSLGAATLELETENTGTICISSKEVTVTTYKGHDASHISMPSATYKHGSTGTAKCEKASLPDREPSCVADGCDGMPIFINSAANTNPHHDDDSDDDSSESSTPQLAALVAATICVAIASLL